MQIQIFLIMKIRVPLIDIVQDSIMKAKCQIVPVSSKKILDSISKSDEVVVSSNSSSFVGERPTREERR